MSSIDMHTTIEPVVGLNTTSVTSASAEVGESIDTDGFESLEFIIQSGTLGETLTPLVEESDDDFSTSNVVDSDFLLGTIANATFTALEDDSVKRIGYVGKKQFVRLTLTPGGTASCTFGAIAELGHSRTQPTAGS